MQFSGYVRADGRVGTRNYVGVLSTVVCANEVTAGISRQVGGTSFFQHQQGCCQTPVDIERVTNTLIGLGRNPNLASVLLVSLGCESVDVRVVADGIARSGKRVEEIAIQECGGASNTLAQGISLAQDMALEASTLEKRPRPICDLVLGLKCGSSDTTSGLSANPALGVASDLLVEAGGTSILGEVTEFIGAEHLLVKRARNEQIRRQILALVDRMERRAMSTGADIRGGQPTRGNIQGGLTTIEEKSLGAIAKAGQAAIQAVYEYGTIPGQKGLVVMDSPGREPELMTGLAAAGATVIAFTTGRGAPQGFPFVPVVKITGNRSTWDRMRDHMDIDVSAVMDGRQALHSAGQIILHELVDVASGKRTRAEVSGYVNSMDIWTIGPVI